jgi:endoglucanase
MVASMQRLVPPARCMRPLAVLLGAVACSAAVAVGSALATPRQPPSPGAGPTPDLAPVAGQDPTPPALRDCVDAGVPTVPRTGVDPHGADPGSPNPLAGLRFFVDPTEPAYLSYAHYAREGRRGDAALMWRIASRPRFRWFGAWTRPDMRRKVRNYLRCVAALQPGTVPLMVVMRHRHERCSAHYTAGGRREDAAERRWYDEFASAVGVARVVIGFEPDALGTLDCLAARRRRARLATLRHGVAVLSRLPNATVYLEGGASDWEPARRTARLLRLIGIARVRGFMLNVTHFDWTASNVRYGLRVSHLTGGKHFIVSTAMNGRGPVHFRRYLGPHLWRVINVWCNPPGRGLGPAPTTDVVHPSRVDAYMWVGRPGESAGACNGGPLPVGSWWPKRALGLARHASERIRRGG